VEVVQESDLSPEALARAIDRAIERPRPGRASLRLDGAQSTPGLLFEALQAKRR
jgi:predicted glycosyltransferase